MTSRNPNVKTTRTPVDVNHLQGADRTRALRVVEQDVMDAVGNIPKSGNSLNRIRALTEKKQAAYRALLNGK